MSRLIYTSALRRLCCQNPDYASRGRVRSAKKVRRVPSLFQATTKEVYKIGSVTFENSERAFPVRGSSVGELSPTERVQDYCNITVTPSTFVAIVYCLYRRKLRNLTGSLRNNADTQP